MDLRGGWGVVPPPPPPPEIRSKPLMKHHFKNGVFRWGGGVDTPPPSSLLGTKELSASTRKTGFEPIIDDFGDHYFTVKLLSPAAGVRGVGFFV